MSDSKDDQEALARRAKILATLLPLLAVTLIGSVLFLRAVKKDEQPRRPDAVFVADSNAPSQPSFLVRSDGATASGSPDTGGQEMDQKPDSAAIPVSGSKASAAIDTKPDLYPIDRPHAGKPLIWKKNDVTPAGPGERRTESRLRPRIHRVKLGETLYAIGRRYGVTSANLAVTNGFSMSTPLVEGQILRIPEAEDQPVPTRDLIPTARGDLETKRPVAPKLPTNPDRHEHRDGYCIRYIVQAKDHLETIAAAHGTSPTMLSARNNGIRFVREGQILVIPVGHILYPYPHYR